MKRSVGYYLELPEYGTPEEIAEFEDFLDSMCFTYEYFIDYLLWEEVRDKIILDAIEDEEEMKMDDDIDSFLRGKMTFDEEKDFLRRLGTDKRLKERALMTAYLIKGLKK